MRIAVVGKGGSGKSTVSASLVQYLRGSHPGRVLAVDADINRHLEIKLGVRFTAEEIGSHFSEIVSLLEGGNPTFKTFSNIPELGSLPITEHSVRPTLNPNEPIWSRFATVQENLLFVRAGTYEAEDFGTACIHVKLKGLEVLLHRLKEDANDFCIFDLTAGTDPLSTSLPYAADMHLLVVEPTQRSLAVFSDYICTAGSLADRVFVIANKIQDEDDLEFIKETIPPDRILGALPLSAEIRRAEQGSREAFAQLVNTHGLLWSRCIAKARQLGRREQEELRAVENLFRTACRKWASKFYQQDLESLLLPTDQSYGEAPSMNQVVNL